MDYSLFIADLIEQAYIYVPILFCFIIIYLFVFRKKIWGILDPLFLAVVSMAASSFCVFVLWMNNWIKWEYILSFLCTELAFVIGFFLPKMKETFSSNINVEKSFLSIFTKLSGCIAFLLQMYVFSIIGFVIFQDGVNHLSVFDGHGILKAFLTSTRMIFFIAFFLKRKLNKVGMFDYFCFFVLILGLLLSGSKSSFLEPITLYFIIEYFFYVKTGVGKRNIQINKMFLLLLACFPICVIGAKDGVSVGNAMVLYLGRIIGYGDIFVMGYDQDVIQYISADSFIKYIFYPGWGSILKMIGFDITPPIVIGVDIYDYYYGITTAGPNARLNFLSYYFLGFWGGFAFLLFAGI